MIEIVGYMASMIGTFMMLPQVVKWYQSKDMKSVSLGMIFMYILNCILWCIYWVGIHSNPLVFANSTALLVGLFQSYLKFKYK